MTTANWPFPDTPRTRVGGPASAVAEMVSGATPFTVAVRDCSPAVGPRVHCAEADPVALEVSVAGETDPPPLATAKATGIPLRPPRLSDTRTVIATERRVPTWAVWFPPRARVSEEGERLGSVPQAPRTTRAARPGGPAHLNQRAAVAAGLA